MANSNQYSLYTNVPTIVMSRSGQGLAHHVKGSTNLGDLKPCYIQEVYPGDTMKDVSNFQIRLTNPLSRPLLDNLFVDVFFFFVPHRLTYDRWEQVMGDNSESKWIPTNTYNFPLTEQRGTCVMNSIADAFGLPQGYLPSGLQVAPFRAFALIYNEWFRDQNVVNPVYVHKGETAETEYINFNPWSENNYMGMPPKASKFHDVFTSALPSPQKGAPVLVTLGGMLPLDVLSDSYQFNSGGYLQMQVPGIANNRYNLTVAGLNTDDEAEVVAGDADSSGNYNGYVTGTNLVADATKAEGISVNDLRLAFATQRLLERSAMYGTRYREIIRSAFGVDSPDARLQVPEFLSGKRVQLNVSEVWQTSSTVNTQEESGIDDYLGTSSAFSKTNDDCGYAKTFVEHGYVIACYVIRQHHNYTQGIDRFWSRSSRLDFYDPTFANIGLQPIYTSELFANPLVPPTTADDDIFGYTEAWYDLRSRVNKVTGALAPVAYIPNSTNDDIEEVGTGLDVYTLADVYDTAPVLSKEFVEETAEYLDRALVVSSTNYPQFIVDFYHKTQGIRRLPPRSIPTGLGGNA